MLISPFMVIGASIARLGSTLRDTLLDLAPCRGRLRKARLVLPNP